MIKKIRKNTEEIVEEAWGVGVTQRQIVYFNGTSMSECGDEIFAIDVSIAEAVKIREELEEVSCDRFAPWPTVEKYLPKFMEAQRQSYVK